MRAVDSDPCPGFHHACFRGQPGALGRLFSCWGRIHPTLEGTCGAWGSQHQRHGPFLTFHHVPHGRWFVAQHQAWSGFGVPSSSSSNQHYPKLPHLGHLRGPGSLPREGWLGPGPESGQVEGSGLPSGEIHRHPSTQPVAFCPGAAGPWPPPPNPDPHAGPWGPSSLMVAFLWLEESLEGTQAQEPSDG